MRFIVFEEDVEQKLESNEKKIAVLKMRLERFEKAFKEVYEDANVAPEELTDYLNTPTNFEPEVWTHIQDFRLQLDNKLSKELDNIRNPFKTSQTYAERGEVQRHWLYVR